MNFVNEIANTLYIPLTMKALESRKADGLFKDQQAEDLVRQLAIPLPDMDNIMQQGTQLGTASRVKMLDDRVADFIHRQPNALLVTIGCGLDNRLLRLNARHTHALNIDLPEVIKIRKQYIREASPLVENKDFSIFDSEWIDYLHQHHAARPKIFVAEGVLMYFSEQQARQLINTLQTHFSNSELWFDVSTSQVNVLMNQREDFKALNVTFRWALDDVNSLCTPHCHLIESLPIAQAFPHIWGDLLQKAPEPFKKGSRIHGFRLG